MADDGEKEKKEAQIVSPKESSKGSENNSRFFAFYSYHPNSVKESKDTDSDSITSDVSDSWNFSLSVLSTTLNASAETDVRKFLSHKLYKGSVYSDEGCVASVDISLFEDDVRTSHSCYYCMLEKENENQEVKGQDIGNGSRYIICFVAPPEDILEHFRPELDAYSKGILKYVDKEAYTSLSMPKESGDMGISQLTQINTSIHDYYLEHWYEETLEYLCRCQALLQENVKFLLYSALVGAKLQINGCDEKAKSDIQRFTNACSLTDILHASRPTVGSIDMLVDLGEMENASAQSIITLDIEQDKIRFTPDNCTKFCEDWGKMLEKVDKGSCGQLRQILETGKIKYTQSINMLKRLLMQAESDYYALYRSYMFLKNSGNCNILLSYIEHESMPEIQNVVKSLQEFIKETETLTTA